MSRRPPIRIAPGLSPGGAATRPGASRVAKPRGAAARAARPSSWLPTPRAASADAEARALDEARARSGWFMAGVMLFLCALSLRSAWVMALPDARLEERGRAQFQDAEEVRGRRGPLLDRNGRLLATTVSLPSLYANPSEVSAAELDERADAIARLVGRSETWVRERFAARSKSGRPLQEIRLGEGLDPAGAAAVVAGMARNEMWLREQPVRTWPQKDLAAPLVGFTDALDGGAAGLEKVLERELRAQTYRRVVKRDRHGNAVEAGADDAMRARAGNGVRLTIDAPIQHSLEVALDRAVQETVPESAMGVVIDVRTGAVLAMASWPDGNPNAGAVRADQNLFKNHAAMDQIEPGSVMKPFVVAAALQEGLVTPDTMVDCELGSWFIGGRTIRDDHPKSVISVTEVIKYSSNIGTAKIGFQLGAGPLLQYLRDFGFARSSGLGLPGEVAGSLRTAANIRTIELATTAFGQGMTSSPVQLASAVATIANDGVRMAPYLVDAVLEGPDATPIVREPRVDRRVVDAEVARAVSRMMETVIEEGGTGTRARVPGYRVAGKTGTAQKVEGGVYSPTKRIGSFVGYIPADRPEIAVAVSIDTPTVGSKYGGIVAAPVFAEVGAFAMRYLGIEADPPTVSVPDPADPTKKIQVPAPPPVVRPYVPPAPLTLAATADGRWVLPDLTGRSLRDALGSLEPAGVALRVDGYGRVTEQSPPAGAIVAPGEPVRIVLN